MLIEYYILYLYKNRYFDTECEQSQQERKGKNQKIYE